MNKHVFLVILLLLTTAFVNSGCAHCAREYNGGHGQGYAMGECAGRLDSNNEQPQRQQAEEARQYHGGTGSGYAMGEYVGPVENINKKP